VNFIETLTASQSIVGVLVLIGILIGVLYLAKEYAPDPLKAVFVPIWNILVKLWKPMTFVMFAILAVVYGSKLGAKKGAAAKRKQDVKDKMKELKERRTALLKDVNSQDKVVRDKIEEIEKALEDGRKELEQIRKDKSTATAESEVSKWNKKK